MAAFSSQGTFKVVQVALKYTRKALEFLQHEGELLRATILSSLMKPDSRGIIGYRIAVEMLVLIRSLN